MHYPAEKKKMLDNAQKRDAPVDVIYLINKLPNERHASPIGVTKEIGKIE